MQDIMVCWRNCYRLYEDFYDIVCSKWSIFCCV